MDDRELVNEIRTHCKFITDQIVVGEQQDEHLSGVRELAKFILNLIEHYQPTPIPHLSH